MRPSRQAWDRARQAGESARRSGKKRHEGPMYAMGEEGRLLREAWLIGWDDEDERRRAR